jgi:hypothetical protein
LQFKIDRANPAAVSASQLSLWIAYTSHLSFLEPANLMVFGP